MIEGHSRNQPDSGIVECLRRIETGPWKLLQLRGDWPVVCEAGQQDDVDLLASDEDVSQLTDAARTWVREGLCHLHIVRGRSAKTQMTIWSLDGLQCVILDLWIELNQLDHGRFSIRAEDCSSAVNSAKRNPGRLPPDLECCIYLHHLACRRRDLSGPGVQCRLNGYMKRCSSGGFPELTAAMRRCCQQTCVDAESLAVTLGHLRRTIRLRPAKGFRLRTVERLKSILIGRPRRISLLSVIGCDGCGKTTLIRRLVTSDPAEYSQRTGKHLYRKSWIYKLSVILLRPLISRSREQFDEQLAPLIFLRAAAALRILVLWRWLIRSRDVQLIDRGLDDFLWTDRKSDSAGFSRCAWLSRCFGIRIPVVHLLVSGANLQQRKQEVTALGHVAYDSAMFGHLAQRCPTDYMLFCNDIAIEEAAHAFGRIVSAMTASASPTAAERTG